MREPYLSKSNFKVARTCATKLYYLKNNYPSTKLEDEYLEFLSNGGFAVGKMAQLMFPQGILIDSELKVEAAFTQTQQLLEKENVVVFEATFLHEQKLVKTDILVKQGDVIELIEVKSTSWDSSSDTLNTAKGNVRGKWREALEDICYQTMVCEYLYPNLELRPYLYLPDKSKSTTIDQLNSWFRIVDSSVEGEQRRKLSVEFLGDKQRVRADSFLTKIDVSKEVALLKSEVETAAKEFILSLDGKISKIPTPTGKKCKTCEFRATDSDKRDGFGECLGEAYDVSPNVFDLYYATSLKQDKSFVLDSLIPAKKYSLFDIPEDCLTGVRGERQRIQLTHTRNGTEWVDPELEAQLESAEYPLHFIDFETTGPVIPYHAKMSPYEDVAFQWSCHTIDSPGATPRHSEWINTQRAFPSFEFATSLMKTVGEQGTLLTWSRHENTILSHVLHQISKFEFDSLVLKQWLEQTINSDDGPDRILDLEKLTKDHFFHPEMKGSTSLKYVLPAIWNNNAFLHEINWLKKYVASQDGKVCNPYSVLEPVEILGKAQVVKEGTGALSTYQEMLYGPNSKVPEVQDKWKQLLLQYCELDTMAMVIVWVYWNKCFGRPW